MALIGYVLGVNYLRHGGLHVPGVSVGSVISFVVLALGILACRPDRPPVHVFAGAGPGAAALRRMAALLIGALLLALLVTGLGQWGPALGDGLVFSATAATVVVMLYLVFLQARRALDLGSRALRDERDFSQTVLRAMREGVIIVGPDGEVLQVNPRWCEITGLPAQDAIGLKPPYPWWPPEEVSERMAQLAGNLAAESNNEFGLVICRADGTRFEVESTTVPVWHQGELRMIVGTYRDLTERNRAEAEVRQAAQQLDHFFDLSTDLMCIAGTDGYFKRLNPVWTQTLGYSREELLARPFLEFIHPNDVNRTAAESAEQAAAGKVSVSFDNRYRCRDGSYRWLSWNATPVPDTSMVYAVARDTTGQRLADQARSLLAAIVDSTDDPTVGMTLDGTIISWNSAAERSYGYRPEEAVGRSIYLITGPGGRREMTAIFDQVARGVPLTHHNTVRRRKDGTHRQVEVTISPIRDAAGAVIGAASVARDIGERLQFEQALARARDEALAAARLKSQFLAKVSHEIRTPMNGVIGMTDLLLRDRPRRRAARLRRAPSAPRRGAARPSSTTSSTSPRSRPASSSSRRSTSTCARCIEDVGRPARRPSAADKGLELVVLHRADAARRRCAATPAACARSWSTWSATRSSSPPTARSLVSARRVGDAPDGSRGPPLRGPRHRHRHRARRVWPASSGLQPGRRLHHAGSTAAPASAWPSASSSSS